MTAKSRIHAANFTPLKNKVFVTDLDHGMHMTKAGIILPDDNMTERGIRPRWARVYAVGPEVDDLKPGEWIYISHARWTNGIDLQTDDGLIRIWGVDYPEHVLLVSETDPDVRKLVVDQSPRFEIVT